MWTDCHELLYVQSYTAATVVAAVKCLLVGSSYRQLHTHLFNGPLSETTRVSRYQKGKTNLHFTEARDSEWQWHQLGHMQVCTSLQRDNHASTPPLSFLQPDSLPAAQSTVSNHWKATHRRGPPASRIAASPEQSEPHLIHGFLCRPKWHPKWHLDWSCHFSTALSNRQTCRQTHRRRTLLALGHIYALGCFIFLWDRSLKL